VRVDKDSHNTDGFNELVFVDEGLPSDKTSILPRAHIALAQILALLLFI
jgi:hypothetical protein